MVSLLVQALSSKLLGFLRLLGLLGYYIKSGFTISLFAWFWPTSSCCNNTGLQ